MFNRKQIVWTLAFMVIAAAALAGLGLAACANNPSVVAPQIARPSNPGGPGPALNLVGDPKAGALIFAANCQPCHNEAGHGGVVNPGSADGTVPALNPIDETLTNKDLKVFSYNLDLFLQHGSTPAGDNPTLRMPAWGDQKKLTDQQIADVIAYVISLNKP